MTTGDFNLHIEREESMEYIVEHAANTTAITISVSPYTWYRLTDEIKSAAKAKNINIALLEGNYQDDARLKSAVSEARVREIVAEMLNQSTQ